MAEGVSCGNKPTRVEAETQRERHCGRSGETLEVTARSRSRCVNRFLEEGERFHIFFLATLKSGKWSSMTDRRVRTLPGPPRPAPPPPGSYTTPLVAADVHSAEITGARLC
ncbi:hypothetical protein EVAR_35780_1 [Eumeta japonica]|uniref:Uncharacterized protein n=1 Tax=Eumeta variegata TaxID=151549 RepID=A0A4C1WMS9_EUMVA|nr:hypothetical protein EVAR_35780_1 [Eumeta japonica]